MSDTDTEPTDDARVIALDVLADMFEQFERGGLPDSQNAARLTLECLELARLKIRPADKEEIDINY
jgi:hypothetical protein